jgi:predicted  nucleic acid-binding Zn-ribbon protein
MATEPADGTDISVSLPPPLEEWVAEQAVSLGVDREELLVQVLAAYRAVADLDADVSPVRGEEDIDDRIESEVRTQLRDHERDVAVVEDRIDDLETDLEEDLESLRNRVLQLRDAVRNRAKTDHTHEEFTRIGDRLDGLATDVADLGDGVADLEAEVADAGGKLDTLAGVLVELQQDGGEATTDRRRRDLDGLRAAANRRGVTDARCHDCEGDVSIPLLSEPSCPHCGAELRDVTTTGIIFTRAVLTGPEPDPAEGESRPDDGGQDE